MVNHFQGIFERKQVNSCRCIDCVTMLMLQFLRSPDKCRID